MTDNPSYRGGQGQGRPGDEYYDERYGRQRTNRAARTPRPTPAGRTGARRPRGQPAAYPPQQGYPQQGG